jgi:hypothetical protein
MFILAKLQKSDQEKVLMCFSTDCNQQAVLAEKCIKGSYSRKEHQS